MAYSMIALLLLGMLILVPLVTGVLLIVNSRRRRGKSFPSCGACGYDVTGSMGTSVRCPECGKDFVEAGIVPAGGQRSAMMLWSGIIILLLPLTCLAGGLTLSAIRVQRSSQAMQQAAAAQAQAVAAKQAMANATFQAPAPLTDDQIERMTTDQATAAMGHISARFGAGGIAHDEQAGLQNEWKKLADKTEQDDLHPPLTTTEINAMSLSEAQEALSKVSVARSRPSHRPEEQARLRREFLALIERLKDLQAGR